MNGTPKMIQPSYLLKLTWPVFVDLILQMLVGNMDQFMVDVTEIPEAEEGELVTLLGWDGEEHLSMETLGELSGRFNYELACDIGKRMPRVYLQKGEIVETRDCFSAFL